MTAANQRQNVKLAARALAPLTRSHTVVISHGNGPQVGLLALQAEAYEPVGAYPLDVLGAESEGMIGYMIEQELKSLQPERMFATILTMVEVDARDPAFDRPTKPIGPVYDESQAERIRADYGWTLERDGAYWRRVVASPVPKRVLELQSIRWLLERGVTVICAGGGGIPTIRRTDGTLEGVEAVIDKDRASALLAEELAADVLILATDVDGVYANWGQPGAHLLRRASPTMLSALELDPGSMGPKVEAACRFVEDGPEDQPRRAVIGALADLESMLEGNAGTEIRRR